MKKYLEKLALFLHKKYGITPDLLTYMRIFTAPWLALLISKVISSKSLIFAVITLILYAKVIATSFLKKTLVHALAEEKKHDNDNISGKVSPDKLCFAYSIESQNSWYKSPYSWLPKIAFDDGLKTYIQMADGMKAGAAPALFVKDDDGVNLVNYRVKDNYYVVDRIFNQAELRNGMKETVVITRDVKTSK